MFDHVSRRTTVRLAGILALGLLLSGCASQQADASSPGQTAPAVPSTSMTQPTSAPAPAPTATAKPVDLNDPTSWIIGFSSVGPMALGADLTATKMSMTAFTEVMWNECPSHSVVSFDKAGFPSFVIADQGDGIVRQIVLQSGGDASGLTATSSRTSGGIGIGATLAQLTSAYPSITQQDAGTPIAQYALPDGQGNWIHFVMLEDLVNQIIVSPQAGIAKEICG